MLFRSLKGKKKKQCHKNPDSSLELGVKTALTMTGVGHTKSGVGHPGGCTPKASADLNNSGPHGFSKSDTFRTYFSLKHKNICLLAENVFR